MHIRHQLLPQDYARRMPFARWLVDRCARNEEFLRPFVIGDEAGFTIYERSIKHSYAAAGQPPEFNFDVNIGREKLTVWIGLCGNGQIIGPFFFNRNIDGLNYLQMINTDVIPQLQQHFQRQAGGAFRNLWWVQDGAPAHRLVAVRERLRELFGQRVFALYHNVEWPPRSPDSYPS